MNASCRLASMELKAFLGALNDLSIDDIRAMAIDIDGLTASVAEEVEVTQAFLHIEATLRRQHRIREASTAGRRASETVRRAAERAGVELPDLAVTRVARWADTVARAIVAEHETVLDLQLFTHAADHVPALAFLTAL